MEAELFEHFDRGHCEKHLCEIISKLGQQLRTEMQFKDFLFLAQLTLLSAEQNHFYQFS